MYKISNLEHKAVIQFTLHLAHSISISLSESISFCLLMADNKSKQDAFSTLYRIKK